jgi:hypothetical protein
MLMPGLVIVCGAFAGWLGAASSGFGIVPPCLRMLLQILATSSSVKLTKSRGKLNP